jgi:hypothetical protein
MDGAVNIRELLTADFNTDTLRETEANSLARRASVSFRFSDSKSAEGTTSAIESSLLLNLLQRE